MTVYGTLLRDATRGARRRVLAIVVLGALGATAQGGALALLVIVMRAIETGSLAVDTGSLIGIAALFIGLALISAGAVYLAAVQSRAVGRSWNERSSRGILRWFASAPYVRTGPLAEHELRQLVMRSPRVMGTAVESIIAAVHPLVYLLICLAVLLSLNWTATVMIAPIALAAAPLFHRFGARVQRDSKSFYEDGIRDIAVSVNRCLGLISHGNVHAARQAAQAEEAYARDPAITAFYDGYDAQILANNRSLLITSCFRAVLLGAVVVILGARAAGGTMSWGEAIVYVVVLAQAAGRGETLLAIATNLIRLAPLVRAYQEQGAPPSAPAAVAPAAATFSSPTLVVTSRPLNRLTFAEIVGPRDDAVFCAERFTWVPGTLLSNAAGEGDVDEARRLLATFDVPERTWSVELDDTTWNELPLRTQSAVRLIALALAAAPVAVVDGRLLRRFGPDPDPRILAAFASKTLVVVAPEWPRPWPGEVITLDERGPAPRPVEAEALAIDV